MAGIHEFKEVIKFDRGNHVFYAPDLWLGNPPMASINPLYHEEVQNLQKLAWEISRETRLDLGFSEMFHFMKDVWEGVLSEDFVFGFRNSVVTKAYNGLEEEYTRLKYKITRLKKVWRFLVQSSEQKHILKCS